ncbi:MAG: FtsQ-type POTRA domain-containing protein [Clostridiales bacterium]|nr:FtsQ-type POTRA domain-containing protein [Clostridiales bacterium]
MGNYNNYNDFNEIEEYVNSNAVEKPQRDPAELEKRQAVRRKKRRRRRRIFLTLVILILAALLAFGVLIFIDKKGYADIETIIVEGNTHYDTVTVLETSGAVTGEGLLSVSDKDIRSNLEKLPYIKSAKITKQFPNTLKITVAERIPQYAVYFGGFFVYLDDEYVMLEKSNDAGGLKIVEGFVPDELSFGKAFAAEDDKNFKLAMKLADALKEKGLNVYKVSFRDPLMRVYFSKTIVCEGSYDNLMKYITELNEILYSLSTQKIERATIYIGDNGYISFSPKIE